jgi:hypothetical protein
MALPQNHPQVPYKPELASFTLLVTTGSPEGSSGVHSAVLLKNTDLGSIDHVILQWPANRWMVALFKDSNQLFADFF